MRRGRREPCIHDGFHTPQSRYSGGTGQLRFVMICDACQAELLEIGGVGYRPSFDPRGYPVERD